MWPKIFDLSSAVSAANQGFWAAVIVAVFTTLAVTFVAVTGVNSALNAWSYIDAAVFGVIAWRIKRHSRFFAVLGLLLFVVEVIMLISQGQLYSIGVLITFALLMSFINGIRGTFAFHRFSNATANSPISSDPAI